MTGHHGEVEINERVRQLCRGMRLGDGSGLFLEEFFDFGYVFGDVYADGVVFDFGDADFPAIFEPAKLLELLDFFEGALGESGVFEKGVALEDVEAEVLEVADFHFGGGIAEPGNGGAGEIQGIFVKIEDGFYRCWDPRCRLCFLWGWPRWRWRRQHLRGGR